MSQKPQLSDYPFDDVSATNHINKIFAQTPVKVSGRTLVFFNVHLSGLAGVLTTHAIGKYVVGNILKDGGAHYTAPFKVYETLEECQTECDRANMLKGLDKEFVDELFRLAFESTMKTKIPGLKVGASTVTNRSQRRKQERKGKK